MVTSTRLGSSRAAGGTLPVSIHQFDLEAIQQSQRFPAAELAPADFVVTQIYVVVGRLGEVGLCQTCFGKKAPCQVGACEISAAEISLAKIDLVGLAVDQDELLQIQAKKRGMTQNAPMEL